MKNITLRKSLIVLILVATVYSVLCLSKNQYNRLTADSMLYFSLAEKYLAGDFHNAVNGYWGPLLAWLIIPFTYLGAKDVVTINVLNVFFGVVTLTGVWKLCDRFELKGKAEILILLAALPLVLKFSLVQPMDFLLVSILILYLGIVFNSDYPEKISSGILSGGLGSLAYFTKAYAFPFFVVHFFCMNILHYFRTIRKEDRKKILKNAIAGFALFALISGTWILVISNKYGHITFSTMRDTNFNAPGPDVVGGGLEFGVPVFKEGFFPPPNETAFVVWEDPSYLRGEKWSPWQSMRHFKHFIKLTLKNVSDGLKIFESFSSFSATILIAYLLLMISKSTKELLTQGVLLYPFFTIILLSGGYLLFHFEERYVWLSNILLLLMGGHVLTVLLQKSFFRAPLRRNVVIIFFFISFIFAPVKYVIQAGRGGLENIMHNLSVELKEYNIQGNFASNREYVPVHDAWHKTFRLAYWLDSRYYGQAGEGMGDTDLEMELEKYDIDYYFIWGEGGHVPQFITKHKDVTNSEIHGLKVYALKRADSAAE